MVYLLNGDGILCAVFRLDEDGLSCLANSTTISLAAAMMDAILVLMLGKECECWVGLLELRRFCPSTSTDEAVALTLLLHGSQ